MTGRDLLFWGSGAAVAYLALRYLWPSGAAKDAGAASPGSATGTTDDAGAIIGGLDFGGAKVEAKEPIPAGGSTPATAEATGTAVPGMTPHSDTSDTFPSMPPAVKLTAGTPIPNASQLSGFPPFQSKPPVGPMGYPTGPGVTLKSSKPTVFR